MTSTTQPKDSTYIIAEIGVNHNGSLSQAFELIEAAANSGADAAKIQIFRAGSIATKGVDVAEYQKSAGRSRQTQYEMLENLELTYDEIQQLHDKSVKIGIDFLATPFDEESLNFLTNVLEIKNIKISSSEITNAPFLLEISRVAEQILLSTGMCDMSDIENALSVLSFGFMNDEETDPSIDEFKKAFRSYEAREVLKEKVSLLHCSTSYPTPTEDANLRAITTLRAAFGLDVGYSDHTMGIHIAPAAVVLGARIVEKHLTLDRDQIGPDHKCSLDPKEFKTFVSAIRDIEGAMGNGVKVASPLEWENASVVRKSIVAGRSIARGEPFTRENLAVKRSGGGMSPFMYWSLIGKTAEKSYEYDELIAQR